MAFYEPRATGPGDRPLQEEPILGCSVLDSPDEAVNPLGEECANWLLRLFSIRTCSFVSGCHSPSSSCRASVPSYWSGDLEIPSDLPNHPGALLKHPNVTRTKILDQRSSHDQHMQVQNPVSHVPHPVLVGHDGSTYYSPLQRGTRGQIGSLHSRNLIIG